MGVAAIAMVGGSVAISAVLATSPMLTAEAVRYAVACLLLVLFARVAGQRVARPRGTEWLWLCGVALTGLVLFNIALVQGSGHAEPAVLGVAVACVPPLLAVLGPLADRIRPGRAGLAAALVVTCGAAVVTGLGRTDATGVAWAAVVCGCDAAFTLLAMPVLGRHRPWGVSVHATWMAAAIYAGAGLAHDGPAAVTRLRPEDWLAVGYLAVITAVAFVLWYSAVGLLGAAGRACSVAWRRSPPRPPGSCWAARRPGRWSGRASPWSWPGWPSACGPARPDGRTKPPGLPGTSKP